MRYEVTTTSTFDCLLKGIKDRRVQALLVQRGERLGQSPDQQGKALGGELQGLRSVRAAGQRYRIIYRVEREKVVVLLLVVGLRREGTKDDVYALAQRLARYGLV